MSRSIPTSNGRVTLVDDGDAAWALRFRWHMNNNGYVYRTETVGGRLRSVRMHRELLEAAPGVDVDHRNGKRHDNRRKNLRLATRAQNLMNKTRLRRDNRSGITGVFWSRDCQRWVVQIQVGGRTKHVGLFKHLLFAVVARQLAEQTHYGAFAPTHASRRMAG